MAWYSSPVSSLSRSTTPSAWATGGSSQPGAGTMTARLPVAARIARTISRNVSDCGPTALTVTLVSRPPSSVMSLARSSTWMGRIR